MFRKIKYNTKNECAMTEKCGVYIVYKGITRIVNL